MSNQNHRNLRRNNKVIPSKEHGRHPMGIETGSWCSVPEGRKRTRALCPGRKYGRVCYQDMGQGRVTNSVRYAQHSFMKNYIFPSRLDWNFYPQ